MKVDLVKLVVIIAQTLYVSQLVVCQDFNTSEYAALKVFYDATEGEYWTYNGTDGHWNFSDPQPCVPEPWQGLTCDFFNSSVRKIILNSFNLSGSIPSNVFGNLTGLEQFSVYNNQVKGSIPASLGYSSLLEYLDLGSNQLVGTIPVSLGNLSQLQGLSFCNNSLTGSLPASLGNLTELKGLFLISNQFTGTIPAPLGDLAQLGLVLPENKLATNTFLESLIDNYKVVDVDLNNLSKIGGLYIDDNYFSGTIPASLGNLSQLQGLGLSRNQLTGTIPASLANLSQLVYLILDDNQLTGTIPASLGNLSQSQGLGLSNNQLTGTIPASLGNLSQLVYLILDRNQLTGTIPASLGGLSQLVYLILDENQLTGTIPASLGNLSQSLYLYLNYNQLAGTIPASLGGLSQLHRLYLYRNQLTGTIPASLGDLSQLQRLGLSNNQLTGTILASLGSLPQLRQIYLNYNQLTGIIPASLGGLSKLEYLYLYSNQLTGTIPASLGSLSQLRRLSLQSNQLTGTIPASLGNLLQLEQLYLDDNQLKGTIPASLGGLLQLIDLFLRSNLLTGTIPASLGNLSLLKSLDFSSNQLTDTIPMSLGGLLKLRTFSLSRNYFSGGLPFHVFKNMSRLKVFDISANRFTGQIPSSLFEYPELQTFSASVNCLSTELPTSICQTSTLENLLISGLASDGNCAMTYLGFVTLPSCIWSLKSLQQLYFSGNSYSGEMENVNLGSLHSLSAGYNRLRGVVPIFFNNQTMKLFDISKNKISGSLYDVNIFPRYDSSHYYADVNRLSGPLSTSTIQLFHSVSILTGGLFSCVTLPSNDENIQDYSCESESLNTSIYYYLALSGAFILSTLYILHTRRQYFAQIYSKWKSESTITNITSNDETKSMMPNTMYLLNSIDRLSRAGILLSAVITIIGVLIYASLKFGDKSHLYNTHLYQYQYTMSGVFLQSPDPAFVLFVFFGAAVFMTVYIFSRVFNYGRKVLRYSRESAISTRSENVNEVRESLTSNDYVLKSIKRAAFILLFLMVPMLLNVGYVFVTPTLNGYEIAAIQLALLLFNAFLIVLLPLVIPYVFWKKGSTLHDTLSVKVLTVMFTSIDLAIPFVAILFSSDLCLHQYFEETKKIVIQYTYLQCVLFFPDGSCYTPSIIEIGNSLKFHPLPVYSGQCRNAMMQQYLPLVIYANAFQTFALPVIYFCFTCQMCDLNEVVTVLGISFEAREYILPDLMYMVIVIWGEFLLILTYGIISPYAALAIGANLCSQLYLLRMAICRYYTLQFNHVEDKSSIKRDYKHLEVMCENCLKNIHIILWPGIVISSLAFSLLLFEMAYDTDNPPESLGASLAVLILTLAVVPCAALIYHLLNKRTQQTLETRIHEAATEMAEMKHVGQVQNPMNNSIH